MLGDFMGWEMNQNFGYFFSKIEFRVICLFRFLFQRIRYFWKKLDIKEISFNYNGQITNQNKLNSLSITGLMNSGSQFPKNFLDMWYSSKTMVFETTLSVSPWVIHNSDYKSGVLKLQVGNLGNQIWKTLFQERVWPRDSSHWI